MTLVVSLQQPLNGNNMKHLLVVAFLLISTFSFAQEIEDVDLKVHKINGKEYYIHVVEQGNTLYAISRKYAIPVEKLKAENPRLTLSLTIGDRLLIPLDEVKRRDLNKSPDIDGNFLIHEVQKKNTLYSLAREYNVEINDIISANPEIEDGLKKGMKIKIPVAEIKAEANQEEYIVPAAASPYITHMVQPKETLYSLSKKYDVSLDSLIAVNQGLAGGLKVDQLINIPVLKEYIDTNIRTVAFDSSAIKPTYHVTLMLPFYLKLMEEAKDTSYKHSEFLSKELYAKAQYAIEFYQGFKIAADSLVGEGLNLELKVLDTGNDSARITEILQDTTLSNTDLIVGPFFLGHFLRVADFAKQQRINIVSPVKLSNKILLGNNYVSKVSTSDPILLKHLANYMYDSLRSKNLLMVYPDQFHDRRRADALKKNYYQIAQKIGDSTRISPLKEVFWDPDAYINLQTRFDSTQVNYLVIPSNDQAFVTRLMTLLNNEKDYEFVLFGLQEWEKFDNIEVNYLQNLNVHLVVNEFINHENKAVIGFTQTFSQNFKCLPNRFSFLGFDVGYYYLNLLKDYGVNFEVMFKGASQEALAHRFKFSKTGIESGYENQSTFIVRYKDYRVEKVY